MKNICKKTVHFAAAFVCAFCCVLLCGCKGINLSGENLLSPPGLNGDTALIKNALEKSVSGEYTLKYPTAGKYRSAYIPVDLTSVGRDEFAVAFYSTLAEDNVVSMHMGLLKKTAGEWDGISDVSISAVGIEKVDFFDLDSDGVLEIIVGWNVYGGVDKQVSVYSLNGVNLAPRIQEDYSDFICCDLSGSGGGELLLLNFNAETFTASAKAYRILKDSVQEAGTCRLDGTVQSFYEPQISVLNNGKTAVFIDAIKNGGTQTEVILYKNGVLTAPYGDIKKGQTSPTYRNTSVICRDINADGTLEIPIIQPAPDFANQIPQENLGIVSKWCSFDGNTLTTAMYAAMNYTDGYYFEYPKRWLGKTAIERDAESRLRTVSVWDTETKTRLGELFKIRTITEVEWDKENNGLAAYTEITRSDGLVYVVTVGNYDGSEKTNIEEIKNLFGLISEIGKVQ